MELEELDINHPLDKEHRNNQNLLITQVEIILKKHYSLIIVNNKTKIKLLAKQIIKEPQVKTISRINPNKQVSLYNKNHKVYLDFKDLRNKNLSENQANTHKRDQKAI